MDAKQEGVAFPPVPLARRPEEGVRAASSTSRDVEPRCEMCGYAAVRSWHQKVCLRCGFLSASSAKLH